MTSNPGHAPPSAKKTQVQASAKYAMAKYKTWDQLTPCRKVLLYRLGDPRVPADYDPTRDRASARLHKNPAERQPQWDQLMAETRIQLSRAGDPRVPADYDAEADLLQAKLDRQTRYEARMIRRALGITEHLTTERLLELGKSLELSLDNQTFGTLSNRQRLQRFLGPSLDVPVDFDPIQTNLLLGKNHRFNVDVLTERLNQRRGAALIDELSALPIAEIRLMMARLRLLDWDEDQLSWVIEKLEARCA